jgi:TAT (twin-arginine translocation) pathway signal sequence
LRLIDNTPPDVSRRNFLVTSGAAAASMMISGTALLCPKEAWGYEAKVLKPETMRVLIKMARDIYPHDHIGERFYAIAMKGYDKESEKTPAEAFVAKIDKTAKSWYGATYDELAWEAPRAELLREYQKDDFFQKVRGGLVTGLYNQQEIWPSFGYEGESASKGGYVSRGFGDIEWL